MIDDSPATTHQFIHLYYYYYYENYYKFKIIIEFEFENNENVVKQKSMFFAKILLYSNKQSHEDHTHIQTF